MRPRKLFATCDMLPWRSFKLLRKVIGSNGGESQTMSFAKETLWLVRLAWAEMHGVPLVRHELHTAVQQVHGAVVTDSRGIYDAAPKSESPQKGLRSARSGVELDQACDDALRSGAVIRWRSAPVWRLWSSPVVWCLPPPGRPSSETATGSCRAPRWARWARCSRLPLPRPNADRISSASQAISR